VKEGEGPGSSLSFFPVARRNRVFNNISSIAFGIRNIALSQGIIGMGVTNKFWYTLLVVVPVKKLFTGGDGCLSMLMGCFHATQSLLIELFHHMSRKLR
jgi:hypothetical protein